jgi:hypothetical protein
VERLPCRTKFQPSTDDFENDVEDRRDGMTRPINRRIHALYMVWIVQS